MAKTVNLDKELINAEEIPDIPMVSTPPEGWPPLIAMDGRNWYEKATLWETMTGQKLLPLKYTYDEDGRIILKEQEEENGSSD